MRSVTPCRASSGKRSRSAGSDRPFLTRAVVALLLVLALPAPRIHAADPDEDDRLGVLSRMTPPDLTPTVDPTATQPSTDGMPSILLPYEPGNRVPPKLPPSETDPNIPAAPSTTDDGSGGGVVDTGGGVVDGTITDVSGTDLERLPPGVATLDMTGFETSRPDNARRGIKPTVAAGQVEIEAAGDEGGDDEDPSDDGDEDGLGVVDADAGSGSRVVYREIFTPLPPPGPSTLQDPPVETFEMIDLNRQDDGAAVDDGTGEIVPPKGTDAEVAPVPVAPESTDGDAPVVEVTDQPAGTVAPGFDDDPLNSDDLVNVEPDTPITAARDEAPRAPAASGACMATVANRYGVVPMVLTDAQIQAFLNPLMQAELPRLNQAAPDGLRYNLQLQLVGRTGSTTMSAAGSPDYDPYQKWLERFPEWRERLNAHALETCIQTQGLTPGGNDPASTSIGDEF